MAFFLIFFGVYIGMHALVLVQICRQAGLTGLSVRIGVLAMFLLALSPMLTRLLPETWPRPVVLAVWWIAFVWFGLLFQLFWMQSASLILEGAARLLRLPLAGLFRSSTALIAIASLAIGLTAYGLYEATEVRVIRETVTSPRLKDNARIVFVSDTHLGAMYPTSRLRDLAGLIQAQNPDLILFGGDIVNDHPLWLAEECLILEKLNAPLGKYGIFGNHERYVGDGESAAVFAASGIRLLRGETADIPDLNAQIIGIDDPARVGADPHYTRRALELLAPHLDQDRFKILLNHRPVEWPQEPTRHDIGLQLSGHTHGGQLFPFNLIIQLNFPLTHGFFRADDTVLGVSRGAGYWGPPMRLMAPPDILVVDLKKS